MPGRNVPGFYYDEAKGKYFRKLPSHLAPRSPKKKQTFPKKPAPSERPKCQISRSNILRHPLGGEYLLGSETGISPSNTCSDTRRAAWARGLEQRLRFNFGISQFYYDLYRDLYHLAPCRPIPQHTDESFRYDKRSFLLNHRPGVTTISIEVCRQNTMLVLGMGRTGVGKEVSTAEMIVIHGDHQERSYYGRRETTMSPQNTLWAAAANKYVGREGFAIAAGVGLLHIHERDGSWWPKQYSNIIGDSDVLAVDWLDENIVALGHRNGKIALQDLRIDPVHHSVPIESPSCVVKVRALDRNRIVVAGLKDELNLYDLRYNRRTPNSPTLPFVRFRDYRNKQTPGYLAGFDVNVELNAIAAACDFDATNEMVMIFDASSGKVLRKGNPNLHLQPLPLELQSLDMATCVRFAEQGNGQPTVMVSSQWGLQEWSWNHSRGNEEIP